jgi:hypothetical protein
MRVIPNSVYKMAPAPRMGQKSSEGLKTFYSLFSNGVSTYKKPWDYVAPIYLNVDTLRGRHLPKDLTQDWDFSFEISAEQTIESGDYLLTVWRKGTQTPVLRIYENGSKISCRLFDNNNDWQKAMDFDYPVGQKFTVSGQMVSGVCTFAITGQVPTLDSGDEDYSAGIDSDSFNFGSWLWPSNTVDKVLAYHLHLSWADTWDLKVNQRNGRHIIGINHGRVLTLQEDARGAAMYPGNGTHSWHPSQVERKPYEDDLHIQDQQFEASDLGLSPEADFELNYVSTTPIAEWDNGEYHWQLMDNFKTLGFKLYINQYVPNPGWVLYATSNNPGEAMVYQDPELFTEKSHIQIIGTGPADSKSVEFYINGVKDNKVANQDYTGITLDKLLLSYTAPHTYDGNFKIKSLCIVNGYFWDFRGRLWKDGDVNSYKVIDKINSKDLNIAAIKNKSVAPYLDNAQGEWKLVHDVDGDGNIVP